MARIRSFKPDFFDDPVLARCSHPARLLFLSLWQLADRCGVFEWDVLKIRKYTFGYEDVTGADVSKWLNELLALDRIRWCEVDGYTYGLVRNLAKHQKFHVKEAAKYEQIAKDGRWVSAPCQHPGDTVPAALYSVNCELLTVNGEQEVIHRKKRERKNTPSAQSASPPGYDRVVACWFEHYEQRYAGQKPKWGGRHGKQLKTLLGTYTADELCELIRYFFAWKRPEVIKAGHSFCVGYASFCMKLDELRADIAAPERRREAGAAAVHERQQEKAAANDDALERYLARKEQGNGD